MGAGEERFLVRFRGVRGSYPVAREEALRTGGNTPCVEIRAGDHLLVLDGGTGIIGLGDEIDAGGEGPGHLAVLLSHAHHDHTQGLPFFRPQQTKGWTIHYYGPDYGGGFGPTLAEVLAPPYFPVPLESLGAACRFSSLGTGDCLLVREPLGEPELVAEEDAAAEEGALLVRAYHNLRHPNGGVLNVRAEYAGRSLVYATDVEGIAGGDEALADFARDADLLVHDAMYTREEYESGEPGVRGYGHSSVAMAVATARMAGVEHLALFHHEPKRDDDDVDRLEEEARAEFPEAFAAREGDEIDLLEG